MNHAVRGSTYEDYDTTSNGYDGVRIPAGLALHRENLASGAHPLAQQQVVELGCGTANYSHALRDDVRRMDGLDGSLGMLARARAKLGEGHVARAFLPHLPLRSASVDGVLIDQVVHHLDSRDEFACLGELMHEIARVLRPGGVLSLGTCSSAQILESYWYVDLIPEAGKRLAARYAPFERIEELMEAAGLEPQARRLLTEELPLGPAQEDPEGPTRASWREGDSVWSLTTPIELERALEQHARWRATGELEKSIVRHKLCYPEPGLAAVLCARRPD